MRAWVLGIAMWLAAAVASADTRVVNSPGDGFLNLRTGPGSQYAIIMPMYHGSQVQVLEDGGNWVRVRHETGAEGWAFERYLVRQQSSGIYLSVIWTSDGYLNLRTGPGTNFPIIRPMYTGSWVEVLEYRGNWVHVRHESGDVGWAYRRYLTE